MKLYHFIFFCLGSLLINSVWGISCGTPALLQSSLMGKGQSFSARQTSSTLRARILEDSNFIIQYNVHGIHQVKWVAGDEPLHLLVDSLYAALPKPTPINNTDSLVFAQLDKRNAPHPIYVTTMLQYFKQAYAYYVGHLGMPKPEARISSQFYFRGLNPLRKFPVDIADLKNTPFVDPRFDTYGVTIPPDKGSGMLLENDFLVNTKIDVNGEITGKHLTSSIPNGPLIHDYANEWSLGLKVTCFHEFYHAVQFAYFDPNQINIWYETSAVGMEERNAPEVNDYWQYFPDLYLKLSTSMFSYEPESLETYGNAAFYLHLTQELGEDFDLTIWSTLKQNGGDLKAALQQVFKDKNKNFEGVYSQYAAQFLFTGGNFNNPLTPISPDMVGWQAFNYFTEINLSSFNPTKTISLPPLSMTYLKVTEANSVRRNFLDLSGASKNAIILKPNILKSSADFFSQASLGLENTVNNTPYYICLANASMDSTLKATFHQIALKHDTLLYAFPNPASVKIKEVNFAILPQAAAIEILNEAGNKIKDLQFEANTLVWAWNLTDNKGKVVRPGTYFYRSNGSSWKPLLLY